MINGPKKHVLLKKDLRKEITLQDGRSFTVDAEKISIIETGTGRKRDLLLDWIDWRSPFHQSLFKVLTNLLTTHSISYSVTCILAFRAWHSTGWISEGKLELVDLESLEKIPVTYRNFIIPNLRRITTANLGGISDDLKDFLFNGYKWEEPANGSYFALITNDPEHGALTDQELHNLHGALNRAYEEHLIDQKDFTLAWMLIGTGLRPIQIARMTVSDVLINDGPEGREVTLKVPLAKGEKTSQTEYWLRRAPSILSECLLGYIGETLPDEYLFLPYRKVRDVGVEIKRIFTKLNTWSDRLECPIPINAYRFRYTLATRALRQGASDYEVARLLTHRSTNCIQYYRASMPELQKPIHMAIGKEMDYFARAFQGKLIRSLNDATYPDDGEQQILDFMHLTGQTLGACGTHEKCHLNAPVSCLSCHRFEPLEDAPWEDLLKVLQDDQAVESEERIRMLHHNAMSSIVEIMAERDKRKSSLK